MEDVKNIIFDLGGVLINLNYLDTERKFQSYGLANFNELFSQAKQNHLFDLYETGKISGEFFIDELIKLSDNLLSENQTIDAWNAMLKDFPHQRIKFLEEVGKRYNIFLLSNTNQIHIDAFVKILNDDFGYDRFYKCFNKVYYSFEIGLRKPNEDVFKFLLAENKLKPSETLFIDDSVQHIAGAQKCGIHTLFLDTTSTDVINLFCEQGLWPL